MADPKPTTAPAPTSGTTVVTVGFSARFFTTFAGVTKILETVFCLLTFICALVAKNQNWWWWFYDTARNFVAAVSIIGAILCCALLVLSLLGLLFKIPLRIRVIFEVIFHLLWVIFMMSCTLVSARTALPSYFDTYYSGATWYGSDALIATAVFSIFALVLFSMDLLVSIQKLLVFMGKPIDTIFAIPIVVAAQPSHPEQANSGQMQFSEVRY